jgi:hypothetical protein
MPYVVPSLGPLTVCESSVVLKASYNLFNIIKTTLLSQTDRETRAKGKKAKLCIALATKVPYCNGCHCMDLQSCNTAACQPKSFVQRKWMVRWRRSQKHGLCDKHITTAAELDFVSRPAVIYDEKIVLKANS